MQHRFPLHSTLLLAGLLLFLPAESQQVDESSSLRFVGRVKNGKVELRWYPTSAAVWRLANSKGYQLQRMELGENSNSTFQDINPLFKPYTTATWRQKTNTQNDYVQAVMEANATASKSGRTIDEQLDARNEENGIFLTWILGVNFNREAAEGAGVAFTDASIQPGKTYAYRLFIPGQGYTDTALFIADNTSTDHTTSAPVGFRAEQEEGAVKLFWELGANRRQFTGYHIERSADGGRTFTRITKTPLLMTVKASEEVSFTDSVKNYVAYHYRLIGLTPFADESEPTDAIIAMGIDKTPASPPANTRAKGDRSKIVLTWELPYQSPDLAGFLVARAKDTEGPFFPIADKPLGVKDRMFIDNKPSPKEPYYIVFSVDTAGNRSSTFSVMASVYDTIAPVPPVGLTGTIDSAGTVKLRWTANTDTDLQGYHIYMANGKNNVYRQLSSYPVQDLSFADTVSMRSLTEEVYYKITAVDFNNNPSDYSEILAVKRPDIIPPTAPVIRRYNVENGKVTIEWINSSSRDVVKHQLAKLLPGGKKEIMAMNSTTSYTDSLVEEGKEYSYTIIAIDDAGLQTASSPLNITVAESGVKPGVDRLTGSWHDRKAVLQWASAVKGGHELVVFKAVEDGELVAYKKLEGSKTTFEDRLSAGKCRYAIKVLYQNGAESELSQPVTIEAK